MSKQITIGVKFTEKGLRIDGPGYLSGVRFGLILDRASGRLTLKPSDEGNTFSASEAFPDIASVHYGYNHLTGIKPYRSLNTKFLAVQAADGIYVSGFTMPEAEVGVVARKKVRSDRGVKRGPSARTTGTIGASDDDVRELRSTIRTLNLQGRKLGVEFGVDGGEVYAKVSVRV